MPREESVGDNIQREISGRSSASFAAWNGLQLPKGLEDGAVNSPARQPITPIAEAAEAESFAQDESAERQSHAHGKHAVMASLAFPVHKCL